MSKAKLEFLEGRCQRLLFTRKGGIAGVLMKVKDAEVQIRVSRRHGAAMAHTAHPGTHLRFLAIPEQSSKATAAKHAVYRFRSFADDAGNAAELPDSDSTVINGVVAGLHYGKHGHPNGVILKTGEFIHLRPSGMTKSGLKVGSKVHAVGKVHMTVLGTRSLETKEINRLTLPLRGNSI